MAQYARPISPDISTGGWTVTPLWEKIDEITPSDLDYITSIKNPIADTFEVTLSSVTDPGILLGHVIRVRAIDDKANGILDFYLYEGANLRASRTGIALSTSWTTYDYTLTIGEADNIGNYSNLSLRVVASGTANNFVYVSWAEFEVPSAGTSISDSNPAFTRGSQPISSDKPSYTRGKQSTSDSNSVYVNGGIGTSDSLPIYLKGKAISLDSQSIYIIGGVQVSDSNSCYVESIAEASDSNLAYLKGKDVSESMSLVYLKGKNTFSSNKSCYSHAILKVRHKHLVLIIAILEEHLLLILQNPVL